MDSNYLSAFFTGKGTVTAVSDFNLTNGVANSATGVTLYFSNEILDGSVYASSFTLFETGTSNYLTIGTATKSTSANNLINLTTT